MYVCIRQRDICYWAVLFIYITAHRMLQFCILAAIYIFIRKYLNKSTRMKTAGYISKVKFRLYVFHVPLFFISKDSAACFYAKYEQNDLWRLCAISSWAAYLKKVTLELFEFREKAKRAALSSRKASAKIKVKLDHEGAPPSCTSKRQIMILKYALFCWSKCPYPMLVFVSNTGEHAEHCDLKANHGSNSCIKIVLPSESLSWCIYVDGKHRRTCSQGVTLGCTSSALWQEKQWRRRQIIVRTPWVILHFIPANDGTVHRKKRKMQSLSAQPCADGKLSEDL